VGKYLELARKAAAYQAVERSQATPGTITRSRGVQETSDGRATKATEATKAPATTRDEFDERRLVRVLTLREVLSEINHPDSGPAKNAELYRRGELSEEKAVEYVACAILHRRGRSFEGWRVLAPTVRAALTHPVSSGSEAN
jgi:hypothetical protein